LKANLIWKRDTAPAVGIEIAHLQVQWQRAVARSVQVIPAQHQIDQRRRGDLIADRAADRV
jgi:hypothetical protein